ncbi:DUF6221 family protein [Streptomyces phaeochromogenes]|uniref:DUF6221 family protein n=1 Tax=Streptomyces phaeochromogenes TaxID=1923 RepID=UPI00386E31BD|nr:DUF6221 family protein [Streptomyces phaeochromogenes]
MYDPVRWLGEQLDEDERIARATDGTVFGLQLEWFALPEDEAFWKVTNHKGHLVARQLGPADAAHIAAHDPARVLREIEAKRGIVRDYRAAVAKLDDTEVGTPAHDRATGAVVSLRRAMCLLATTYDARPGFKEEWRP